MPWKPGPRLGPGTPWDLSPDGRLAVVGQELGVYRLVERATGKELLRLEDPDQVVGSALFTPDGTRLVIAASWRNSLSMGSSIGTIVVSPVK